MFQMTIENQNNIQMKKIALLIAFVCFGGFVYSQSDKALVRQGNKSYQSDSFSEAEINYRKALDKNPNSLSGTFNLADAIYQQEDFKSSAELFSKIGMADVAKDQKANAFYNLGNSFLKSKQYEQSIEAYKMALRNNPSDADARYNLEYARKMLKKEQDKQQNKDQDKKDDQKQDQQNKDQNKDNQDKKDDQKDQKDQEKDQQDKKDQDQNQQNPQQNDKQEGKPEQQMNDQQSKQISKKDAERMLEALKNNEKKTLDKLKKDKKAQVRVVKKEKDW